MESNTHKKKTASLFWKQKNQTLLFGHDLKKPSSLNAKKESGDIVN